MKRRNGIGRREFLKGSVALYGLGAYHPAGSDISQSKGSGAHSGSEASRTVSLDGAWQIADSISADEIPAAFDHSCPVPGLANLAEPAFPDVGAYLSRESIWDKRTFHVLPESEIAELTPGPKQKRNYFWYQKTFQVSVKREVAILKINKAQFGTAVWLNGKKVGSHYSCFTAGYFNVTEVINWEGENQLLVRIGAHPEAVPSWVPTGIDFEKNRWTPGIYDSVSLHISNNPVIETIQVAPHINPRQIVVQTKLKNYGKAGSFTLAHEVKAWKSKSRLAESQPLAVKLGAGEEKTLTETIPLPGARLWSPENPFLYVLESRTEGDAASTRFGVREFYCDTATQRAYLNGKLYFMRGSNITLHRFFDDPQCRALPWDEAWLRKLLIDIPKKMSWNSFRYCIGPVPDRWFELADEAGFLIDNQYFVWTLNQGLEKPWSKKELIQEYKEWMRDNWNHPSVVIWDATNETQADIFGNEIIPAVRSLDLSNRPWMNSWNLPDAPNDPAESHPYLFIALPGRPPSFKMTDLETMSGCETQREELIPLTAHSRILNEYGWLWLTRDGAPTPLTKPVYDKLLGPEVTPEQRLELDAYLLGGLTEFWRAHRRFAAVLHFVYLTSNYPGVFTADHFMDIRKLILEPHFEDYMGEAFKPLGVYINFWQPTLAAGSKRRFRVMVINDNYDEAKGTLALGFGSEDGTVAGRRERSFALPGLGQQTYEFDLEVPSVPGKYLLKAELATGANAGKKPTLSRRKLSVIKKPGTH